MQHDYILDHGRSTSRRDVERDDNLELFLELSRDQRAAVDDIQHWWRHSKRQVFHLAGYAGTGKTTLVTGLPEMMPGIRIQYAAFTGKAASVLRKRGAENAVTLHSLLYGAPTTRRDGELVWRRRGGGIDADLIVADECSMVHQRLGRDLLAIGVKVLVTGDQMQLPPVSGSAFFDGRPDFSLTEIHRQATNSQPLKLATAVRNDDRVRPVPFDLDQLLEADIVICAMNATRRHVNRLVRRDRGFPRDEPVAGDRVVCFRNNYQSRGVLNGTLWEIERVDRGIRGGRIDLGPDGRPRPIFRRDELLTLRLFDEVGGGAVVTVPDICFGGKNRSDADCELDDFDFGYALTCHKAQGSEWDRVVVIDETESPRFKFITGTLPLAEFRQRWLYTAVTRARQSVELMGAPT